MARKKVRSATDQRKFTLVYNDFLESNMLNHYEKMVFIALKKFADNDTMMAFPSLKTLRSITGISLAQVRRCIEHMEQLGVIKVEHRLSKEKGKQSNIYTLYDYAEIWKVGSSEDVAAIADEVAEARLIAELRARGYTVTKEKGLESEPTKAQNQAPNKNHSSDIDNNTMNSAESQVLERYSLEEIQDFYNYKVILEQRPYDKNMVDSVMSILHTCLNTSRKVIRVNGENRPAMTVISKLLKLNHEDIVYCIDKYSEQNGRIKRPSAYMLTMLFNAKEQATLDFNNLVQYDMSHQDMSTE